MARLNCKFYNVIGCNVSFSSSGFQGKVSIGTTEGQQVFTSLDVTSDTYEAAVKSLGDHFGSHTNIAVAQFRLRQRQQQYWESAREYEACLRQLARKCKFGTMENEIVREQLIETPNIPTVREKLLLELGGLSFATVIELACQVENSLAKAQQMARTVGESLEYSAQVYLQSLSGSSLGNSIQEVSIRRRSRQKQVQSLSTTWLSRDKSVCGNCGFYDQSTGSRRCSAKGEQCGQCGKLAI